MIADAASLTGRLERYRATLRSTASPTGSGRAGIRGAEALAERLAETLDGEVVRNPSGTIVRCERPSRPLPVDRRRLATLPGQPPAEVPLICLDTETTGLATAAGTVAFLIGLGRWESDRFRQVQFILPDQSQERALLVELRATIPVDGWLVTYNGRGFDWPLMVTRYRMAGQPPPPLAGHLDLLPIVRRLFRHRMPDARLQTAEAALLGQRRIGDVGGWEIPGRYLDFLRDGSAAGLIEVLEHNDIDVRSLGRLLAYLADGLADPTRWPDAEAGDLAGLARAFARDRRLTEALDCLEVASVRPIETTTVWERPWWSVDRPPDFGGRPPARRVTPSTGTTSSPWTAERIAIDRARLLRRLGRHREAAAIWTGLAVGSGRLAIVAMIETAKIREHRLGDLPGALSLALAALDAVERRRRSGQPEADLEADLRRRLERLRRRTNAGSGRSRRTPNDGPSIGDRRQTDAFHDQRPGRGGE
jgi:uncharacterized protein